MRDVYAKATPRPWKAAIYVHPGMSDTVCIKDGRDREIIHWAGFDGVPCTKAEIKANARLVAHAVNTIEAQEARIAQLEGALATMVYETTHLSPMEDDGSHWCKISAEALAEARAALNPTGATHDQD